MYQCNVGDIVNFFAGLELNDLLFDHRPLELNEDDYQRVCRIPKKKVFFNI